MKPPRLAGIALVLLISASCSREDGPEEGLRRQVIRYFTTWSQPDMVAYRACFDPGATIHFIDRGGGVHVQGLDEFIRGQELGHEAARAKQAPMTETPTDIEVAVHGRIGTAVVRWELRKGGTIETGTDFFIFLKRRGGWRIVSLVFEADSE
jgi:hypothetical protein